MCHPREGRDWKELQVLSAPHRRSSRGGAPIIEDDVLIGANAVLLGDITVHKGAKIGAGAVVLCDVPEDSTDVGVPAKVLAPKAC